MIRVCNVPRLIEYDDKWGAPTGTYGVRYSVFWLEESTWRFIDEFQNFNMQGPITQDWVDRLNRLIRVSMQCVYQFNGRKPNGYVRQRVALGEPDFAVWEPVFGEVYMELIKKAKALNENTKESTSNE